MVEIDNITRRFYNIKGMIDDTHIASVKVSDDAKLAMEQIIHDYYVKKAIIEELEPSEEFYIELNKWIDIVEKIIKECYPLIYSGKNNI